MEVYIKRKKQIVLFRRSEKEGFTKEMIFGPDLQNYVSRFLAIATWSLMVQKHQKVCSWIILHFTEAKHSVTEHSTVV